MPRKKEIEIVLDTETTGLDFEYDEVIEIGAVLVKNGEILDKFATLVRPERTHALLTVAELNKMGYEEFTDMPEEQMCEYFKNHLLPSYIETLTGISNDDVLNAPTVEDVIESFVKFVGSNPIVGHNVSFDINFLYDMCESAGLIFSNNYIDTMRISRKLYPEWNHHRLKDLVENLQIPCGESHRALSDATAAAACFEKMKEDIQRTQSLSDFANKFSKTKFENYKNSLSSVTPQTDEFDDTNPVFGKTVVFTGALSSMTRKEAFQIVADLGGFPESNLTQKTNFLVVGNEEFVSSVKNGKTNKMKKAEQYKEKGLDILVLSENTFFEMVKS